jgi:hypothetical protein
MLRITTCRRLTTSPPYRIIYSEVVARWPSMSDTERQNLTSLLQQRAEGPWKQMTIDEKRTAYFLAYGFESVQDPNEWKKVFLGTAALVGASIVTFWGIRTFLCKFHLMISNFSLTKRMCF